MTMHIPIDPAATYGGILYKGTGFAISIHYSPVIMVYENGLLAIHDSKGVVAQAPITETVIRVKPLSGIKIKINGKNYVLRHFISRYGIYGPYKDGISEYQKNLIEHITSVSKSPLIDTDIDTWHALFLKTNAPNVTPQKQINSGKTARIFYWTGTVVIAIVCFVFLAWYAASNTPPVTR